MAPAADVDASVFSSTTPNDPRRLLLRAIIANIVDDDELQRELKKSRSEQKRATIIRSAIDLRIHSLAAEHQVRLTPDEQALFLRDAFDEIYGLGPLEKILRDPDVTEVMVNGPDSIFVERKGLLALSPLRFFDREHLCNTIQEIVAPIGRRIDAATPMVDARLPDGSRVNAVLDPIGLDGPYLTIRKFPDKRFSIEELIKFGSLDEKMSNFLRLAVEGRLNIVVSGGTGSGKTTLLNALASFIPDDERIVTVEDVAELRFHKVKKNVCRMETRPPNTEGKGAIQIRDLVRNALRMRPDRIVVGEVRGGEAFDLIQAMNTGHDGSLTTGHANTSKDALARLEAMIIMAGTDLPLTAIRDLVASGIDLIIHVSRLRGGVRKIVEITEVGPVGEAGRIATSPLWTFKAAGTDDKGRLKGDFIFHGIPEITRTRFDQNATAIPDEFGKKGA